MDKEQNSRTIKEILDYETGEIVNSNTFFSKGQDEIVQVRYLQEEAKHKRSPPKFICFYCSEILEIRGGIFGSKEKIFFFQHPANTVDCPIKSEKNISAKEILRRKFHGQKESLLHLSIKSKIQNYLNLNFIKNNGVSDIKVEKTIKGQFSKTWKKPDVQAIFKGNKLIFEIQLSTTFLSVIEERQSFYKNENVFVLWILKSFQSDDDLRKFTENDVIYSNKQNAFVLDNESLTQCEFKKDLVLKCYFKKYKVEKNEVVGEWYYHFITLNDLTFDDKSKKVFFFESDLDKKEKEDILLQVREYNSEKEDLKLTVDDISYALRKISEEQDFDKILKHIKKLLGTYRIFGDLSPKIEELYTIMNKKIKNYYTIKSFDFISYNNTKMSIILNKTPKQESFILANKESIFYQTQEGNSFERSKKYRLLDVENEPTLKRIISSPYVRFLYCFDKQLQDLENAITLKKEEIIFNFKYFIEKLNQEILIIDSNCIKLGVFPDNELRDFTYL